MARRAEEVPAGVAGQVDVEDEQRRTEPGPQSRVGLLGGAASVTR